MKTLFLTFVFLLGSAAKAGESIHCTFVNDSMFYVWITTEGDVEDGFDWKAPAVVTIGGPRLYETASGEVSRSYHDTRLGPMIYYSIKLSNGESFFLEKRALDIVDSYGEFFGGTYFAKDGKHSLNCE